MFSLIKDFKYPSDWLVEYNIENEKLKNQLYQEDVSLGVFEENEKSFQYCRGTISSTLYFYPHFNYEQLLIAGRFVNFGFYFDDYLESSIMSDENAKKFVKTITNILIDGKLSNESTHSKLEIHLLHCIDKMKEFCIKLNVHIDRSNQYIKHLIDWLNSCNPFNKSTSKNLNLDYDTYNYYKRINAAGYFLYSINIVVFPEKPFDCRIWINPVFDRIVSSGSYLLAAMNDCGSYAKELRNNEFQYNPLYFLQKSNKCTFEEAYQMIINLNSEIMDQLLNDEKLLLKSVPEGEERENLEFYTTSLKLLLGGNLLSCLSNPRYEDKDSPFIEQQLESTHRSNVYLSVLSGFDK